MAFDATQLLDHILEGNYAEAQDMTKEELDARRDNVKTEAQKAVAESITLAEEDCDDDDDDDDRKDERYQPPIRKVRGAVTVPNILKKAAVKHRLRIEENEEGLTDGSEPIAKMTSRSFATGNHIAVYFDGKRKIDLVFMNSQGAELAVETTDLTNVFRVLGQFLEEII